MIAETERAGSSLEAKKRVLIVDDDKSILRVFTRILQKGGYDVDTAETGKEALEKAGASSYHVALIDVRLPDMDGTDLLPKLRASSPGMVKIVITGFPSLENGSRSLDRGAVAYLVKPVRPEELLMIIGENLKRRGEKA